MVKVNNKIRRKMTQRLSSRRVTLIVAALAGVALALWGASANASASGGGHRAHTIMLRTTLVSATTNSAGLGGPGDVIANVNSFVTSTGVTGHADTTCQIFPNSEQECTASFVFPNGMIDASAAITLPLTSFTAPITGGSGDYEGVAGHIDNVVVAPGVIDRTFHLIFPEH